VGEKLETSIDKRDKTAGASLQREKNLKPTNMAASNNPQENVVLYIETHKNLSLV